MGEDTFFCDSCNDIKPANELEFVKSVPFAGKVNVCKSCGSGSIEKGYRKT
jgi:hypothetical protein